MERKGMLLLVLLACGLVLGQEWPQWRGPNRDGKVKGFVAPQTWPEGLTLKWKAFVGQGDSTPALAGQRIYCFTRQDANELITCLAAVDGKQIWQDAYQAVAVTGPAARHPGPRSSPAVADGKLVSLGVGGVISCLDADTGKVLWRKDVFQGLVPRFYTGTSPVIVDGTVILHLGGEGNGAVIAFDLASGNERWRWGQEGPSYSSPGLMTADGVSQVVVMTEASVVGLGIKDGRLLWRVPFKSQGMSYNAATPIVDGQVVIIAGAGRGTKAIKIERTGDQFTATELWSCQIAPQFCSPVLKEGLLFGLSDRGNIYCIDAKVGQVLWTDGVSRRNFGALLDLGNCLALLPQLGELVIFTPEAKGYNQIASYKVSDNQTYAHPVFSGNRLYVKDLDSLTCWAL